MIAVLTVPARQKEAIRLSHRLGGMLITDSVADARPSPLRGLRGALNACAHPLIGTPLAHWAAVFQDDALVPDWLDAGSIDLIYTAACEQVEQTACAVSLYYGGQSRTGAEIRLALARGQRFARRPTGEYLSTVATIYPIEWLDDWLAYSLRDPWIGETHDDECWGAYLDGSGRPSLATVPCLVQHDNTLPSTSGENHGARYAATPSPTRMPPWYT